MILEPQAAFCTRSQENKLKYPLVMIFLSVCGEGLGSISPKLHMLEMMFLMSGTASL